MSTATKIRSDGGRSSSTRASVTSSPRVATEPVPVVVPTQYVLTDTEIVFHLVATNPVFAALEENPQAVMSVAGDWAFIPGAWKTIGDEDPGAGDPDDVLRGGAGDGRVRDRGVTRRRRGSAQDAAR